ncbi:Potassium channel subfamily K member [Seminavis robusta]|uniref:Potassium channel subfamily K member n=1 Tax=Seminavis robusta TaxID=568900 RepID=A0A9N8EXP2_9STRA|nr:Potassium channel subfamily K member [Seminavis robusta]|eukprot:Sro2001_g310280.1 Potassium channel subfamily K member (474) ;mRNA; f:1331-2856
MTRFFQKREGEMDTITTNPPERLQEQHLAMVPEKPTVVEEAFQNEQGEEEPSGFLERIQHRVPHLYYVTVQLILPLLILIGMAFFFGWLLARAEMKGEIEANDAALRNTFETFIEYMELRQKIWKATPEISTQCLEDHNVTLSDYALEQVQECAGLEAKDRFRNQSLDFFFTQNTPDGAMSFNWMTCDKLNLPGQDEAIDQEDVLEEAQKSGLNRESSHDVQFVLYVSAFYLDLEVLSYLGAGLNPEVDLYEDAAPFTEYVEKSTGGDACRVHVAGGAIFWFTIMTTIGYGNTAPVTPEGRALVITLGFLTIIGFLALNNTAATVIRVIVDDMFLRCNLNSFVHGPIACIFWLAMTIVWVLVLAVSIMAYKDNRLGGAEEANFPLGDAFWFSYVTTTTVGFGDFHLEHEEFQVGDMFFIPLLVLIGFNILGIFAEKLIELYNHYFPERNGFEAILEQRRRKANGTQVKTKVWV